MPSKKEGKRARKRRNEYMNIARLLISSAHILKKIIMECKRLNFGLSVVEGNSYVSSDFC